MKNSKASKIVVAVGLAAVYGTGLAMVTLRHAPDNHAAQNAAAAPTPQPAAMTEVTAPVTSATVNKLGDTAHEVESVRAEAPAREKNIVREQKIRGVATGLPAETRNVERPSPAVEAASSDNESAKSEVDAPSSEQAESASSGNESQVDADLRT